MSDRTIAQVIEPELVVGAVGDVAGVVRPLLGRLLFEAGDDEADVESQPLVNSPHPLCVESCEVIVDRDEVNALATETVEIRRQRADQGLALARFHLGYPAEVQCRATHQLNVEVTLPDHTCCRLAHNREGFDEQIFEALAALYAPAKFGRLGLQCFVAERAHLSGECVDVGNQAFEGLQLLTFTGSEDAIEDAHAGMQPTGGGGADLGNASVHTA